MKKLIYRKVKIVKTIPSVDLTQWYSPREIEEFNKGIKSKKKPPFNEVEGAKGK